MILFLNPRHLPTPTHNANYGMGISGSSNKSQQYSPFMTYAMWLTFNKMADDVPSETRTNQAVVSLLDHLRPPAPNGITRTLPVLKCTVLV